MDKYRELRLMRSRQREMKMKMATIAVMLMVVLFGAVLLSYGVHSIINSEQKSLTLQQAYDRSDLKGYYADIYADQTTEAFCVEEYFGIFCFRKSYFYFVKEKGTDCWIAIRSDNEWINNFDGDTNSNKEGVKVTGDYWMTRGYGIDDDISAFVNKGIITGKIKTDCFIDAYHKDTNVLRIVASLMCFIFFFALLYRRYVMSRSWYMGPTMSVTITWVIQVVASIICIICWYQGNFLF